MPEEPVEQLEEQTNGNDEEGRSPETYLEPAWKR